MKLVSAMAGACVTACLLSSAASAGTVTATFENFNGAVEVELIGRDDAPGTPGTLSDITDIGDRWVSSLGTRAFNSNFVLGVEGVTLYDLTRMTYRDDLIGETLVAEPYVGGVVNNLSFEGATFENGNFITTTEIFDLFFAAGVAGSPKGDTDILYWALFEPDTLTEPKIEQAIQTGFDQTFTFAQGAEASRGGANFIARSNSVDLTNFLFEPDPDSDPGNGGGMTGGGGGMTGGGGGTPDLTPIPLPASGLLLLGGFAALGAMRRKRV